MEGDFENNQQPTPSDRIKKFLGGFSILVIIIIIGIYFATGIYQIGPSDVGLVKRFGKFVRMHQPGINYHLPAPFESVVIVDIRSLRKIEIGFRTTTPGRYTDVAKESLMMTGDNNFADVETAVQYKVKDPVKFAFNVKDPNQIVKFVSEATIRERVAQRSISEVLTTDRDAIAFEAQTGIQEVLDKYGVGIKVENVRLQEVNPPDQVLAAFDDVNSALQDQQKITNQAQSYYNDIVPRAQGQASETVQEARAYKGVRVLGAEGEVARFNKILERYINAPEITRTRLYIETMERILPNSKKILLLGEEQSGNTLNFLDLEKIFAEGSVSENNRGENK